MDGRPRCDLRSILFFYASSTTFRPTRYTLTLQDMCGSTIAPNSPFYGTMKYLHRLRPNLVHYWRGILRPLAENIGGLHSCLLVVTPGRTLLSWGKRLAPAPEKRRPQPSTMPPPTLSHSFLPSTVLGRVDGAIRESALAELEMPTGALDTTTKMSALLEWATLPCDTSEAAQRSVDEVRTSIQNLDKSRQFSVCISTLSLANVARIGYTPSGAEYYDFVGCRCGQKR